MTALNFGLAKFGNSAAWWVCFLVGVPAHEETTQHGIGGKDEQLHRFPVLRWP